MLGEKMPAAHAAELAIAALRLAVSADVALPARHLDCIGLPQRERIDGRRRPAAARCAMTISGGDGLAFDRDLHGTAETASFVRRHDLFSLVVMQVSAAETG